MFADRAKIFIKSGKGGDGHVSFRRELYVANGGPDGGDGGRGGDIIFEVDKGLNTLADFRHKRKYVASDGESGGKRKCHGKDAKDLIIKVPEGTVIKEFETGKVIADMSNDNQREIILKGGRGGLGNMHFATSTMQIPKFAKPGQMGVELFVTLELKVIADVGLVGYPNAGKSTLISRVSNAKPKIANYPFTTLNPHLGVVDVEHDGFVIADIPGLIEGASKGIGLGHDFLRHIERCKVLVHVVDIAGIDGRNPVEDIKIIMNELKSYDENLVKKPAIIVANKMDLFDPHIAENLTNLKKEFSKDFTIYEVSAVSGLGIKELIYGIYNLLKSIDDKPIVFEKEYEVDYSSFKNLPYTIEVVDGVYIVEGDRITRVLGYTNLDSEKGFVFFQNFLKSSGILAELEKLGINEGDTVRMYGHEFEYFK